eukprot:TRINITY_DN54667_c0_g1_i1.p1 TRINITY_DN54667_c0_g1~~TRINITY_DN54667_c0_g1_i1.p1  ORF type:complete len:381 (+),score=66.39 TRINITY_DN54667_c0_g1_i1:39-1181(+)
MCAASAKPFVDHYEVLGSSPHASTVELKKAYRAKLREFHPDKRPGSANGTGERVTQALYEAWEALRNPARRAEYDAVWHAAGAGSPSSLGAASTSVGEASSASETVASPERASQSDPASPVQLPWQKADVLRSEGNELYRSSQASSGLVAAAQLQAAKAKYSKGLELAPKSHRLWVNRALCHAALHEWGSCREDALRALQLRSDFAKGWCLLAKALWQEGSTSDALRHIEVALGKVTSGTSDLLSLKEEVMKDHAANSRQELRSTGVALPRLSGTSRNASASPVPSCRRVATPPELRRPSDDLGPRRRQRSRAPAPPDSADEALHPPRPRPGHPPRAPSDCDRTQRAAGRSRSTPWRRTSDVPVKLPAVPRHAGYQGNPG